ncbi:MAG: hypothetical protein K8R36_22425 [Planctomycetales bacterium]|nr:hypothetical protein [Planctomycetales bacterium]
MTEVSFAEPKLPHQEKHLPAKPDFTPRQPLRLVRQERNTLTVNAAYPYRPEPE